MKLKYKTTIFRSIDSNNEIKYMLNTKIFVKNNVRAKMYRHPKQHIN